MIPVALFSFQRTPSLVILLQYFVASSSPSVDVPVLYISVRFVVAPCLATKSLRDFRELFHRVLLSQKFLLSESASI